MWHGVYARPAVQSRHEKRRSVRKALQVRTIFNLLGPLVNPCLPSYQLLGVADLPQMRLYTNVFQKLGIGFAVVNNLDGYDEISLTDEFKVMTNRYETIYKPSELGFSLARQEELYGGTTLRRLPASSTTYCRTVQPKHRPTVC